jgi:hypothetical protein
MYMNLRQSKRPSVPRSILHTGYRYRYSNIVFERVVVDDVFYRVQYVYYIGFAIVQ